MYYHFSTQNCENLSSSIRTHDSFEFLYGLTVRNIENSLMPSTFDFVAYKILRLCTKNDLSELRF